MRASSFVVSVRVLLFVLLCTALPLFAFAQEEAFEISSTTETIPTESVVIANINLSDATIVSQTVGALTVGFVLENQGTTPQFDIRYGLELIKTASNGAQSVADSVVLDEVLTLAPGEKVNKTIVHPLTLVAPGEYSVWLSAKTAGGVLLGLGNAGTFTIDVAEMVEIQAETCELMVEGEEGIYTLYQGVDVAAAEELSLSCTLINHGKSTRTVVPQYETFKRTTFGEQIQTSYPSPEAITIAAGAKEEVIIPIPKAALPQAYNVAITLVDEATKVASSNRIVASYVVQGASASINSIDFNKSYYVAGEEIVLNLFWTGAADNFYGSRKGTTTDDGVVIASVQIVDGNGITCTSPLMEPLTEAVMSLSATANVDCYKPAANITLTNSNGEILDSREIAITAGEMPVVSEPLPEPIRSSTSPLMLVTIIALAVAVGTILLVLLRNNKVTEASKILIITMVAASGFFSAADTVNAFTLSHTVFTRNPEVHTITINTNKSAYYAGESVVLSASAYHNSIGRGTIPYTLSLTMEGQVLDYGTQLLPRGVTQYISGTLVAPAGLGAHVISVTTCTEVRAALDCSSGSFSINVVAPPPAPPTPPTPPVPPTVTGSISGTSCEIQEGDSTCLGTLTWAITNAASPNVYNSNGTTYSISPNGTNAPVSIGYGVNTVSARNGASALASVTLATSCATGLSWIGGVCDSTPPAFPAALVSVSLDKELIRSGETVITTTEVTAAYPTRCTLYGVETAPIIFMHAGDVTPTNIYNHTSRPLTAAQVVTVTCEPSPAIAGVPAATGEARVNVIPSVQEI